MAKEKTILEAYLNDMVKMNFAMDPYKWVMYCFPWGEGELADHDGPDEWQIDVMNTIRDHLLNGMKVENAISIALKVAVASGNGIGKSCLVAWLNLWALSTFEDTRGTITANTENQLRTKTWPEIAKWYRLLLIKEMFILSATAIYSSDKDHEKTWRIDAIPWSENNPEAIAGLHNTGKRLIITFDEASAISDLIFEAIEGALTDKNTEIFWFCFGNPTRNNGRFYDSFNKYKNSWITKQIDSRKVKMTNKEQLNQWVDERGIDNDWIKVHVLGRFPSASLNQLISTEDVEKAMNVQLREEMFNFAPKIITCDPAWMGDDYLEIGFRQGLHFKILLSLPKNDNDIEIANIIANFENEYEADAVILDAGYGTGIISAGRTMGRNWFAIWFNGKSPDPGCLNMRAYMWKETRDWLKSGGSIPNDKQLYADLIGPEVISRTDGKIQLESKKDMKTRGLPSPNKGDALALSFAVPVAAKETRFGTPTIQQFAIAGYNPIGRNNGNRQFANASYNPIRRRRN
jgi:hypothetical protein